MGTHRKTRTAKLNRTVTAGAVAGATAIGFGALSSMTAPTANADWWVLSDILNDNGNDNGHNRAVTDNNTLIAATNGNGNVNQQTWGAGNNINNQLNQFSPVIGGAAANVSVTAAVGGSSIAARHSDCGSQRQQRRLDSGRRHGGRSRHEPRCWLGSGSRRLESRRTTSHNIAHQSGHRCADRVPDSGWVRSRNWRVR